MAQQASGSASRRVRRIRRHGIRALPYPGPQVFDGDVAPQKSVIHDLKIGLKTIELSSVVIELSSVVAKAVGGPRAAEEREEAMEHAQA